MKLAIKLPLVSVFELVETLCEDGHFEETACAMHYARFRAASITHGSQITGVRFERVGNHPANALFTAIDRTNDAGELSEIAYMIDERLDYSSSEDVLYDFEFDTAA